MAAPTRPMPTLPFPGNRDMLMLAAGVLIGVLLGPAVLGRVAPSTHRELFGGIDRVALTTQEAKARGDKLDRLESTGVSKAYVNHELAKLSAVFNAKRAQGRTQRLERVSVLTSCLILALVVVMLIEAGLSPDPTSAGPTKVRSSAQTSTTANPATPAGSTEPAQTDTEASSQRAEVSPMVGRLIGLRYGLVSLWIALMLASPVLLLTLPWLFVAIIVVLGFAVALVPLGRKRRAGRDNST